jgi:hypothetical protein
MRKDLEAKFVLAISQAKTWDNFGGGKHAQDMYAELLIPKQWNHVFGALKYVLYFFSFSMYIKWHISA